MTTQKSSIGRMRSTASSCRPDDVFRHVGGKSEEIEPPKKYDDLQIIRRYGLHCGKKESADARCDDVNHPANDIDKILDATKMHVCYEDCDYKLRQVSLLSATSTFRNVYTCQHGSNKFIIKTLKRYTDHDANAESQYKERCAPISTPPNEIYFLELENLHLLSILIKHWSAMRLNDFKHRDDLALKCIDPWVIEDASGNLWFLEKYIETDDDDNAFRKWTNNAEPLCNLVYQPEGCSLLIRFTIWSYIVTAGRLAVTDLQGWIQKPQGCILLTDPAILTGIYHPTSTCKLAPCRFGQANLSIWTKGANNSARLNTMITTSMERLELLDKELHRRIKPIVDGIKDCRTGSGTRSAYIGQGDPHEKKVKPCVRRLETATR
jgi:hypothetical protein